jgi:PPOX class probable F420-dependent enzyme
VDIDAALAFAASHSQSILITLRRDGRPQSSNVSHGVKDGALVVSVTADRAKTRNAARDPRVSLHISAADFWSYAVIDGEAELMAPAADPADATVEALVDYYRSLRGEHPDWDEYRRVMVQERRLLLVLHPTYAYGMVPQA